MIVHKARIDADENANTPILILSRKILNVWLRSTSGHSPVPRSWSEDQSANEAGTSPRCCSKNDKGRIGKGSVEPRSLCAPEGNGVHLDYEDSQGHLTHGNGNGRANVYPFEASSRACGTSRREESPSLSGADLS